MTKMKTLSDLIHSTCALSQMLFFNLIDWDRPNSLPSPTSPSHQLAERWNVKSREDSIHILSLSLCSATTRDNSLRSTTSTPPYNGARANPLSFHCIIDGWKLAASKVPWDFLQVTVNVALSHQHEWMMLRCWLDGWTRENAWWSVME